MEESTSSGKDIEFGVTVLAGTRRVFPKDAVQTRSHEQYFEKFSLSCRHRKDWKNGLGKNDGL